METKHVTTVFMVLKKNDKYFLLYACNWQKITNFAG